MLIDDFDILHDCNYVSLYKMTRDDALVLIDEIVLGFSYCVQIMLSKVMDSIGFLTGVGLLLEKSRNCASFILNSLLLRCRRIV